MVFKSSTLCLTIPRSILSCFITFDRFLSLFLDTENRPAPGTPVPPTSVASGPTTEAGLRKTISPPEKSAAGKLAGPAATRIQPHQATAAPPSGIAAYEFRPDLAPDELGIAKRPLDAKLIRRDFPILEERVHGRPLVWLDNAATTQKPNAVIQRLSDFYRHENSNIHRAAHELAARATDAYESAREKSRRFLNAATTREIIFVRGATEGINLVAQSWGRRHVGEGDEVVSLQASRGHRQL